jgi:alkyl hydroperoxide reductase subunit AhpC
MALCPRRKVPAFKAQALMPDGEFAEMTAESLKGTYTVLFWYPLDHTFVCPTEIIAFSDRIKEFEALRCKVVAASVDSHFSHLAWTQVPRNKGGLGKMAIPILSDLSRKLSADLGCLITDPEDGDCGVTFRATYIIAPDGTIRSVQVNDLPVGRSVDETLRLVQAFQYSDKHGEVCPAGWKPGSATIKPSPQASQEYFSKLK